MKINSIKIFLVLTLFLPFQFVFAQEPQTIRVKKESNLSKAVFDNVDLRLMVIDVYGNPKENAITFYKLYVKNKRETKEFTGYGNGLSGEMINYLNKQKSASKLFFTEVSAKDDNGHLVKLPDVIDTWFPNCKNCEKENGRKR